MKTELKTITPEYAKTLLETKNLGNRPLNTRHVKELVREITEGRWKVNGDTICFNDTRLIDGQHRLAAVVAANMPIQSLVVEGLPFDVFDTKDVGKRRSPGDTLFVRGEANSARVAAALVMIERYMTKRVNNNQTKFTNTEVEMLLKKHPGIRDCIIASSTIKRLIRPAVIDACYYLFSQKDKAMADEFVDKVLRGTNLDEKSPYSLMRERLVANTTSKSKINAPYMMALCIKTWNLVRLGKNARSLAWRSSGESQEDFPEIV